MRDHVFFPVMALIALALIALSLVWPQGLGARSPAPFGHAPSPMRAPPSAPSIQ
jgi:hypothetical protein